MNIGIDAHVLSGKFQGSRTYLLNLYRSVLELDPQQKYNFLGHWDNDEAKLFGNEYNYINFKSNSRFKRLTYQTYGILKENNIDLYHSQYISPLLLPSKNLITIHDILFETHPEYFTKSEVIRNRILVRRSARQASQIHVVSEYSKRSVIEKYNIDESKIKVVPNGVDLNKFNHSNIQEAVHEVEEKYRIKDYILSVGRIEPRKNHLGILRAYVILKQKNIDVGPLVIIGQPDFGYNGFFEELDKSPQLKKDIIILKDIDDKTLPKLYKAAKVFVYPSFAEGFGIPPLEAMASGLPVITSKTTSIPEVVGNAGILVDPSNVEEISEALQKVIENDKYRNHLRSLALERAKLWTWENAAKKYLEAISTI